MQEGAVKLCILKKEFAFIHNNRLPLYQKPDIEQAAMSPLCKARSGSELTLEVLAQNLLLVSATSCWARTEEEGGGLCGVLGSCWPSLSAGGSRASSPVDKPWGGRGPRTTFELSSSQRIALYKSWSLSSQ